GKTAEDFREEYPKRMEKYTGYESTKIGSIYSLYLYDTVLAYLTAVSKVVNNSADWKSGRNVLREIQKDGFEFKGRTGMVKFDRTGDRLSDFALWHKNNAKSKYEEFTAVHMQDNEKLDFEEKKKPNFITDDGRPPPSTPKCGYLGDECRDVVSELDLWILLVIVAVIIVVVVGALAALILCIRKCKRNDEMLQNMWKIPY
ncbi:unnamed protein product, partial [Owenia fusiformis]